ncbi:MAG: NAD-binding protein [Pseudomonadota bacterium]
MMIVCQSLMRASSFAIENGLASLVNPVFSNTRETTYLMIDLNLLESYVDKFPSSVAPFLHRSLPAPTKKIKILNNIPLTSETILKIFQLIRAGFDVTVTSTEVVPPRQDAVDILKQAGVNYANTHQELAGKSFDVVLDCCAEFLDIVQPALGAVELTRSGAQKFREAQLSYPVISVDDSRIKALETCLGTGDGFLRGLEYLNQESIIKKTFIVVGFGKVGRGVAHYLRQQGAVVAVAERAHQYLQLAANKGYVVIDTRDLNVFADRIQSADGIVTATGKKHLLSHLFSNRELFANKILANVGAEDEFGDLFADSEVLHNKLPVNFCLENATKMQYLDPVFYAHNLAIDGLVRHQNSLENKVHILDEKIDHEILEAWCSHHGTTYEAIDAIADFNEMGY